MGEVQLAIIMMYSHFCLDFLTKICNDLVISFFYYYYAVLENFLFRTAEIVLLQSWFSLTSEKNLFKYSMGICAY